MAKRISRKYPLNITGVKFGKLTAIEKVGIYVTPKGSKASVWRCKCDCGNEINVVRGSLTSGNTRSCGCLREDTCTKHHGTGTRLYQTYRNMINRCYREDTDSYYLYGARGIGVCDEWRNDFNKFREWALSHGYEEDLTIDRLDNDKDYCPENCKWSTFAEQANHTSHCHYVYDGNEKLSISQFARKYGVKPTTFRQRIVTWGEDVAIERTRKEWTQNTKNLN